MYVNSVENFSRIGLANADICSYLGELLGSSANYQGWALEEGSYKYHGSYSAVVQGAFGSGDVVMIAVDLDAGKFWAGVNGAWAGDDVAHIGNPAAGTNALYTNDGLDTLDLFPAACGYYSGQQLTIRCSSGEFTYSIPAGFSAWND